MGSQMTNNSGVFPGFTAPLGFNLFFTIQDYGEREEDSRVARWAMRCAIPNAIAIGAKVG